MQAVYMLSTWDVDILVTGISARQRSGSTEGNICTSSLKAEDKSKYLKCRTYSEHRLSFPGSVSGLIATEGNILQQKVKKHSAVVLVDEILVHCLIILTASALSSMYKVTSP